MADSKDEYYSVNNSLFYRSKQGGLAYDSICGLMNFQHIVLEQDGFKLSDDQWEKVKCYVESNLWDKLSDNAKAEIQQVVMEAFSENNVKHRSDSDYEDSDAENSDNYCDDSDKENKE